MIYNFPKIVANATLDLLMTKKALVTPSGLAFYVWQRGDRLVLVFDPSAIALEKLNDDFVHILSTRLHGRRVVRTNSRGMFLQVGFDIPKAPLQLTTMSLELSAQPSPWHMPVGLTEKGPLWISLVEGDSFLMGGSRDKGKTGEEHAWIQALLHGNQTLVYAFDFKQGSEFGRYLDHPNFRLITDMAKGLKDLAELFTARRKQLTDSGYPNILMHNEAGEDFIMPVALFVDEAADVPDASKPDLVQMIRICRYLGLHPVVATNQPTQAAMFAKTNLSTRIAFRVPHHNDSITVLGYKGAESLADERGRGLIVWKGSIIEFQSFTVSYPMPSERAREMMRSDLDTGQAQGQPLQDDPPKFGSAVIAMAEEIRSQWNGELSKNAVSKLLANKPYAGSSWTMTVDKVIAYLASTTTSTGENEPESLQFGSVAA